MGGSQSFFCLRHFSLFLFSEFYFVMHLKPFTFRFQNSSKTTRNISSNGVNSHSGANLDKEYRFGYQDFYRNQKIAGFQSHIYSGCAMTLTLTYFCFIKKYVKLAALQRCEYLMRESRIKFDEAMFFFVWRKPFEIAQLLGTMSTDIRNRPKQRHIPYSLRFFLIFVVVSFILYCVCVLYVH